MSARLNCFHIACLVFFGSVAMAQKPPSAIPAASQNAAASPKAQSTPAAAPATRNQAGVIVLADGIASLVPAGGAARRIKVGDTVSEGDVLISGKDGEVHVQMGDTGFLLLRPNSRIQIEKYVADGGVDDNALIRLASGGLRSITGWIGKFNAGGYKLRTSTATIGIRGTDHETRFIPEGSTEGEPGTYDRVYAGETYIETPGEKTSIAPNQAGFASSRGRSKPRLLADMPGFFKPGPHEAEINKKHAEIQQQIDQRRDERRKAIAEKRAALEAARTKVVETLQENTAAEKQAKQSSREQRSSAKEKREALQEDMKAAQALHEEIQQKRKSLEEDVKSGQITRPEVRTRRKELQEKEKALLDAQASIKQRHKALMEAGDARIEDRFEASQERQKALHDQVMDAREKRKAVGTEREAATEEIKSLRQDEGKRYREELKNDKKNSDDAPAKPQTPGSPQ